MKTLGQEQYDDIIANVSLADGEDINELRKGIRETYGSAGGDSSSGKSIVKGPLEGADFMKKRM